MCWKVQVAAQCINSKSPCCNANLYKIEWDADAVCKPALAYSTLDGAKKAPFFQLNDYPAIKVTNINKKIAKAAGTEVCLFLRKECNTLKKLGKHHDGDIAVAIFNEPSAKTACCPSQLYV
jgi:Pherophorin